MYIYIYCNIVVVLFQMELRIANKSRQWFVRPK